MTKEKILDESTVDRYDSLKSAYQQNREYLINDGKNSNNSDPDLLDDNSDTSGKGSIGKGGNSSGSGSSKGNSGSTSGSKTQSGKSLKLSVPK